MSVFIARLPEKESVLRRVFKALHASLPRCGRVLIKCVTFLCLVKTNTNRMGFALFELCGPYIAASAIKRNSCDVTGFYLSFSSTQIPEKNAYYNGNLLLKSSFS